MFVNKISLVELEEKKPKPLSKYHRKIKGCNEDQGKQIVIDVYSVLDAYGPLPHTLEHAIKKLLVPGKRSGGKSYVHDIKDAIWSLNRELEMIEAEEQIEKENINKGKEND